MPIIDQFARHIDCVYVAVPFAAVWGINALHFAPFAKKLYDCGIRWAATSHTQQDADYYHRLHDWYISISTIGIPVGVMSTALGGFATYSIFAVIRAVHISAPPAKLLCIAGGSVYLLLDRLNLAKIWCQFRHKCQNVGGRQFGRFLSGECHGWNNTEKDGTDSENLHLVVPSHSFVRVNRGSFVSVPYPVLVGGLFSSAG
jgi:hypothetical protein